MSASVQRMRAAALCAVLSLSFLLLLRSTSATSSALAPPTPTPWTFLDFLLQGVTQQEHSCYTMVACHWGLGSNFNTFLWRLNVLKHMHPTLQPKLYYNHTPSPYQCFTNYSLGAFLRPLPELIDINPPPENSKCIDYPFMHAHHAPYPPKKYPAKVVVWPDATPTDHMLSTIAHDEDMESMCQTVSKFWILAPELEAELARLKAEIYGAAPNPRGAPIVAIHARGGDKVGEYGSFADEHGRYPLAPGMWRLVNKYPAMRGECTCIIIGDDAELAAATAKQARFILKCARVVMRAPEAQGQRHKQEDFNELPLADRCTATKNFVIDLELLAWAHFTIAIQRSNVDELAYYLRRCKYFRGRDSVFEGTGIENFGLWSVGLLPPLYWGDWDHQ